MKSLLVSLLVMAALVALDQAPKVWVRANVPMHETTVLVPNLLEFTHVENRGVSFSVLGNLADRWRVPLLVSFSGIAVLALAGYWLRHRAGLDRFVEWAFLLILPGAAGNLIDRAVYGTVTDFLHFRFYATSFFVNNIADIEISLGVIAYLIGALRQGRKTAA